MLIYCWWEWQSAQPLWKVIWLYSKIKNIYDLTSLTWECTQYWVLSLTEFKTWTKMLVEPFFIIVQNWVWPRCPSLAKGINCVVFLLSSMKKKKKHCYKQQLKWISQTLYSAKDDSKEEIQYNSIYVKFKNRKNKLMVISYTNNCIYIWHGAGGSLLKCWRYFVSRSIRWLPRHSHL